MENIDTQKFTFTQHIPWYRCNLSTLSLSCGAWQRLESQNDKKGVRKSIFLIGEYENDKKAITKDNCLNDVKLKCYDSRILKQII